MKEMSIEELLSLQLEILFKVDSFCRNNSISYTVFGGTAIGTVRHKGYIPWDDDIDIAMTRPNYERFINSFNGVFDSLEVYAPELDLDYYAPYANVCDTRTLLDEGLNGHHGMDLGVKIDVFPIDGVATDIDLYHADKNNLSVLWYQLFGKRVSLFKLWQVDRRAVLSVLKNRLLSINKSYASIQKNIIDLMKKYPYDESKYVDLKCFPWPTDSRCLRSVFEKYEDAIFENLTVSIISDYDEYLSKSYGNYMQLPPVEKRIPHHGFTAYWKN